MNINNKVTLTGTTGKPVLTYKIYYWDYTDYQAWLQAEKKLLFVGKAYNFNNAATIDIYINDIIKNIPRSKNTYGVPLISNNLKFTNPAFYISNLISNLEVNVVETSQVISLRVYQDYTKSYIDTSIYIVPGWFKRFVSPFITLDKLQYDGSVIGTVVYGSFNDSNKRWGLKYVYTDGTEAEILFGETDIECLANHGIAISIYFPSIYLYENNPQPSKTVEELWIQYDVTNIQHKQEQIIVVFTNDGCKHNVLSFENRNGSISYLPLKGNTIYSESIQRHMKIDMFDRETVFASLVDETITVNTGWLTDAEAKALEDLYVSQNIYFFDVALDNAEYDTLGKYLAVNLDEGEYKQRQFKHERSLKNYTIKLKLQDKEVL